MTDKYFGGNNGKRTLELFSGLLACEDITIKHNAYLQTAEFELDSRTLSIPAWKNITDHLYCLFVGHEVAHALFTPADKYFWLNCDPNLKEIINVVEDVRVDKLIKAKYPGLKTDYTEGHKDLMGRGFFPTENLELLGLIDKLNVHFRLGDTGVNVPFADDEVKFLPKVASCISFESVVTVSKEILEFLKKKQEKKNKTKESGENKEDSDNGQQSSDCEEDNSTESEESDSNESGDNDSDKPDSEESESENGSEESENGNDSEDSDEDDKNQESNSSESDEDESDDGETESKTSELESTGQSENKAKTVQEMLDEKIRETFSSKHPIYNYKQSNLKYVDLPTTDVTKLIKDHVTVSQFLSKARKAYCRDTEDHSMKVKTHNESSVNYLVKEFELRKAAKIRSKSKISKTGLLNSDKLYSYEYNEDLFKRSVVMEKGKNHGVVILFDMSGSMGSVIFNVYEQILNVVMFCRKVKIPYEVYGFTTGNRDYLNGNRDYLKDCATSRGNEIRISNCEIRQYFSNRMTQSQFVEMFSSFSSSIVSHMQYEYMGGTPLVESLVVMNQVVERFKSENALDIVNLLVISDGADGEGLRFPDGSMIRDSSNSDSIIVRDRNHKTTSICDESTRHPLTSSVLNIIRQNHDCRAVCFYLSPTRSCYGTKEQIETYKNEGFYIDDVNGYDRYFVVSTKHGLSTTDDDELEDIDYIPSMARLRNQFQKILDKKISSRIFLRKFIEIIA